MPKGEKNQKLTPAQIDEIVKRYTTMLPDGTWEGTPTLARDFGVAVTTITRWLYLRGIPKRTALESHSGGKQCKPVKNLPQGDAPACACGCRMVTDWNRRKNRWNRYVEGHYRREAPYKQEAWLREEYETKRRTLEDISAECGVVISSIVRYMNRYGIERRSMSEAHIGLQLGETNPAWKGGVAQWEYSPEWKRIARGIRDRDKWTCQDCGEQRARWGAALHVHHIDENKLNNDPANLISLCSQCHRDRHALLVKARRAALAS